MPISAVRSPGSNDTAVTGVVTRRRSPAHKKTHHHRDGLSIATASAPRASTGKSPAPVHPTRVHILVGDDAIEIAGNRAPLGVAVVARTNPSILDDMRKVPWIAEDIPAVQEIMKQLDALEAKGYELVVHQEASVQDFFDAAGDPWAAGIWHAGHSASNGEVAVFKLKSAGGDRFVPLAAMAIEDHRQRFPDWKLSRSLQFIISDGCQMQRGQHYYHDRLGIPDSVRFIAAYDNHNSGTILAQTRNDVVPLIKALPNIRSQKAGRSKWNPPETEHIDTWKHTGKAPRPNRKAARALLEKVAAFEPDGSDFDVDELKRELTKAKVGRAELAGVAAALGVPDADVLDRAAVVFQEIQPDTNVAATMIGELLTLKFITDNFWELGTADGEIKERRGDTGDFEYLLREVMERFVAAQDYHPAALKKIGLEVERLFESSYLL